MGKTENTGDTRVGGFTFVTRRRVLQLGAAGAGLFLAGGVAGLLGVRGCAPRVDGLRILSRQHYRTLTAIADTLIPRGGPFPLGALDFDLARAFDTYLDGEPPENVRDFKRALHLVEYGPVVFERRATTFSHLGPDDRVRHWRSWETSQDLLRRQVALAFRRFLLTIFYDQPEVWQHIDYPGPMWSQL